MCGACGSGIAVPPWEVITHGGTRRDLAQRAREAELLSAARLRVSPFGHAGYQSTTRTGRAAVHPNLDSLLAALLDECGTAILDRAYSTPQGPVAKALLRAAHKGGQPALR